MLFKGMQVCDYSFRKHSSYEDLHEEKVVILKSKLAAHSLVSYMEKILEYVQSLITSHY